MKSILAAMNALVAVAALHAADYHLKSGGGVSSAASYEEGAVPPAGSDVWIPANGAVTVSSDADYAFLNTMASVRPQRGAVLTCSVEAGKTNELACAVYVDSDNSAWDVGTLVKEGGGELRLTHPGTVVGQYSYLYDYNVNLDVRGGVLAPFHGVDAQANYRRVRNWTVAAGAKICLSPKGTFECWRIDGEGEITCRETGTAPTLRVTSVGGAASWFRGALTGNLCVNVTGGLYLLGESNTFTGGMSGFNNANGDLSSNSGHLGIARFGAAKGEGGTSMGTKNYITCGTGGSPNLHVLYLGSGEAVNKSVFAISTTAKSPFILDAGAAGGLDFQSGTWYNWSGGHAQVVLCGSNATEVCSIRENIFPTKVTNGTETNVIQVTKRGTGTWRFLKSESGTDSGLGLVAVEDGVLQFDSLKDRGVNSALGKSAELFEGMNGTPSDEAKRVPYAFRLGGASSTNAVFEYVGGETVFTATRPIGLGAGAAHLRSSGTKPLKLRGVGGVTAADHELVLDGDNADENVVSTVSNGVGTVSVTKAGAGAWTLAGEQSFSGLLSVRGGTLNLLSPAAYSYFKLVIKETLWNSSRYSDLIAQKGESSGSKFQVALGEFALYSADGRRQNVGFSDGASVGDLRPGEASFGTDARPAADAAHPWRSQLSPLFNGRGFVRYEKDDGTTGTDSAELYCNNPGNRNFSLADASSWLSIVCRLTNATPAIASYDLGYTYGTGTGGWGACRVPTAYAIEGSVDGLEWETVAANDAVEVRAAAGWLSDGHGFYHDDEEYGHRSVTGNGDCFALRGAPETPPPYLSNISGLLVSGGATVRAVGAKVALPEGIRVTLDAADSSGATVDGLEFPETGTLDVLNYDRSQGRVSLPVSFAGSATYANLRNWTVCVNGVARQDVRVRASNGSLKIVPLGGTMLVIR